MRLLSLLIVCVLIHYLSSCRTVKQPPVYLQSGSDTSPARLASAYEPRIQKNDLLSILVRSMSLEPTVDLPYNPVGSVATGNSGATTYGYLVDQKGNIQFPRLGSLSVEGLTKLELAEMIRKKLSGELNNPSVDIRFLNYKITVLGEVGRQGPYPIANEKVSILEAIGMAGDVTVYGKKNNITVIRDSSGVQKIGQIDLTKKEAFSSPYYYLQQNDVVIVDADIKKYKVADQLTVRNLGIITSVVSTVAFLITVLRTR
jgi:polysaccharide biosynthesis/export protein